MTSSTGSYIWPYADMSGATLDVSLSLDRLVSIDEYSGHITTLTGGITTQVVSSTSESPAHLMVSNGATPLMKLVMRRDSSSSDRSITITPPGGILATGSLAVEMGKVDTSAYSSVQISPASTLGVSLTGGYIVHDASGQLLFALSSNYEFAVLDDRLRLSYDESVRDRIALRLRDSDGNMIMTLFFPTQLYSRIY